MDNISEVVNTNCRETRKDVFTNHRDTEDNVNSDACTENKASDVCTETKVQLYVVI